MQSIPWIKQLKKHRIDKLSTRINKRLELDEYNLKINKNDIEAKDRRKDELWSEQREMTTIRILNEEAYNGSFKEKLEFLKKKLCT